MNSDEKMYKKKYLKYKMKYLSLQRGAGFLKSIQTAAQALKGAVQESFDPTKITKPQRDEICETNDFTIIDCNKELKNFALQLAKLSKEDQLKQKEQILKIAKEKMLNSYQKIEYKESSTFEGIKYKGSTFEGQLKNGMRYQGILEDKDGRVIYVGTFKDDGNKKGDKVKLIPLTTIQVSNPYYFLEYNGEVDIKSPENKDSVYQGNNKNQQIVIPDGYGIMKYKDDLEYEGFFMQGKKHGKGKLTSKYRKYNNDYYTIEYDGFWENNKRHGYGESPTYKGQWVSDRREGNGVEVTGDTIYEGTWRGDYKNNGILTYTDTIYYKSGEVKQKNGDTITYVNGKKQK